MGIKANIVKGGDGLWRCVRASRNDESGATSIEYSLIVGLIFLAIVGAIRAYTETTNGMYEDINTTMTEAME